MLWPELDQAFEDGENTVHFFVFYVVVFCLFVCFLTLQVGGNSVRFCVFCFALFFVLLVCFAVVVFVFVVVVAAAVRHFNQTGKTFSALSFLKVQ